MHIQICWGFVQFTLGWINTIHVKNTIVLWNLISLGILFFFRTDSVNTCICITDHSKKKILYFMVKSSHTCIILTLLKWPLQGIYFNVVQFFASSSTSLRLIEKSLITDFIFAALTKNTTSFAFVRQLISNHNCPWHS